ncbi:hypothetical protein MKW98_020308 [Papaver atlanticum]|uniref:RRM domain-containing protein n=1 Tax=Papaver atlanticum TaxID=357466 RepID=A0AAD4TEF8_9MAGN|nr:hypothetical protein MKW98_020308 [Papaver atlanticum]
MGKSSKRKKTEEDEPAVKSTGASKTLIAYHISYSADKSHVINFFKQVGDDIVDVRLNKDGNSRVHSGHIEFATEEAANKAVKFHNEYLLGHHVKLEATGASSKTVLMEDLPFYTEKSDVIKFFKQVGKLLIRSGYIEFATEEAAKMAVKLRDLDLLGRRIQLQRQATGTGASKTLCLKNLPFDINKSDVIKFFENVGDIADVRFSFDPRYETFRRVVHVEFATEEATKEAAKWNGRYLLGRPVRLAIVRETLCTRFYGGFAGVPPGTALVEFSNLQALHRALDLNGKEVGGNSLTITDYISVYLDFRFTGRKDYYKKPIVSSRGFYGAGLGKYGSPLVIPTGNKITFDSDYDECE